MGMMQRHHATVPAEYANLSSPVAADEESLARGGELYTTHCASCHGESGLGDGPAGKLLDPPASPVAHTSQMMGDGYLFWRISQGGVPFKTAMPAWQEILDEQARWDVINYVRALGAGQVHPGGALDPTAEAARHAEMLAQAIQQGVIDETEAQVFEQVHDQLQERLRANPDLPGSNMDERQAAALAELVAEAALTQEQADQFLEIHERLVASGLMQ
jgi:mono/diheme cytochrome c family protein